MKIAIISPGITKNEDYVGGHLGGIETQMYGLAKKFSRCGNDVYIIRKWKNDTEREVLGIRLVNIPPLLHSDSDLRISPLNTIASRIIYSKLVAYKVSEIKPDIIIMNELFSSYYVSKLAIPKIYIIHIPPYALISKFVKNGKISIIYSLVEKFEKEVLVNADKIIAINKDHSAFLKEKYPEKIVFIPNAVDLNNYRCLVDGGYILYGGRLVNEKGVHYLLQAYSEMDIKIRDNTKLIIVGSGPEEEILKKQAKSHQICRQTKFLKMLPHSEFLETLSSCSVFVLPSLFECMPVSVLEAMACSKPVIASDISGSRDLVSHGINGFLFNSERTDDLTKYLELLMKDHSLRKRCGMAARKLVEESFTFEKTSKKYLDLFDELL